MKKKKYHSQNVVFNVIFNIPSWFLSDFSLHKKSFFFSFHTEANLKYKIKQIHISFFFNAIKMVRRNMPDWDWCVPPFFLSFFFSKWEVNKIPSYFQVFIVEKQAILSVKHNRKFTMYVTKIISFYKTFSQRHCKENKVFSRRKKKKPLKEAFFQQQGKGIQLYIYLFIY